MGIIIDIISSIGKTAKTLADAGLIKDGEYEVNFEGEDTFYSRPETGLLLAFNAVTQTLKSVQFTLIKTTGDRLVYTGEMPAPFSLSMDKGMVRELLGTPDHSTDRRNIPTLGVVGGHDMYLDRLPDYPALKIRCLYSGEYKVRAIAFESLPSAN